MADALRPSSDRALGLLCAALAAAGLGLLLLVLALDVYAVWVLS